MSRPATPGDLYTLLRTSELNEPALLVHFEGWIDAGQSAALAITHILDQIEPHVVARFETEWLLDHRARRPTMHVVNGVNAGLDWPTIELAAGRDAEGNDVMVLHGAEPDHNWRTFVEAVLELAGRFGVRRMLGLGAYPAAVPHTRPSRLSVTASTPEIAGEGFSGATLDVPAGVESALERAFEGAGIDALGVWAQVPHYVSAVPYAAAAQALLEGLGDAAGLTFDLSQLATEALATRNRLDALVRTEDSHGEMLAQLEKQHDQFTQDSLELPTSDELAAEVERFLRSQEDGPDDFLS